MKWSDNSWNRGLPIKFIVLEKGSERYYFAATNDAEITEKDLSTAEMRVKKQFGYSLGWTNAYPSWLAAKGYKCLD